MRDLGGEVTLTFPQRWTVGCLDLGQSKRELDRLSSICIRGADAVIGVYMRICDLIRSGPLTDDEARSILSNHFAQPRVSEILRVARAPDEIYSRYTAGFFGFKAAVRQCRAYNITPADELKRRQIRRAIGRLISLAEGPAVFQHGGRTIEIR